MNDKELKKLLEKAAERDEKVAFSVSMPKNLYDKLKKAQAESGVKSFNKFLVRILEGLFQGK